MTTHMPPTDLLAEYASGSASPGLNLLMASHLTLVPESRRQVAALESIGGALLADEAPVAMAASALETAFAAIDDDRQAEDAELPDRGGRDHVLPRPLREHLSGQDEESLPWRFRLPGVSEYVLPGFDSEQVSILRARPGSGIPQHTHEGVEITLVLSGELHDGDRVLRAGDVAVNTDEHDHRPRIMGDETCYCLVVMDGGLRFTGTFSRALNLIGE
ncbi:MAG: ChrR family anti-sigma-E factor [Pseudomonadota bacterium]